MLQLKECSFQKGVRAFRAVQRMTFYLRMGYKIFDTIYNNLNLNKYLTIYSYMIAETVQSVLSDYQIIQQLLEDEYLKIELLLKLVNVVLIIVQLIAQIKPEDIQKNNEGNVKNKLIDSNWRDFPEHPKIILNQLFLLLVECMLSFSQSLELFYQSITNQQNIGKRVDPSKLDASQHKNLSDLAQIIQITQKSNLKINKCLLQLNIDESSNQSILNALQRWVMLSGSLSLNKIMDSYLKVLAKNCIDESDNIKDLSKKNHQSITIYFNIPNCLRDILDASSWHIIF